MLHQQGVRLILSSHDHVCQYSVVLLSSHDGPGIHVVIRGGAGSPLRSGAKPSKVAEGYQTFREDGLDLALIRQMEIYHYCLVDIDPDKITIQVMEVTGDPEYPLSLADKIVILGVDS